MSSIYGFRRCAICTELTQDSSISCQNKGHTVCVECLHLYVAQQLDIISLSSDKFLELVQNEGAIICPDPECTSVFNPSALFRLLNKNDRGNLHRWVNKAKTAMNHQEAGNTVLSALFPSAIMCPHCLYGPVDHRNCDDLNAHHGQSYRGRPGIIANDCPRCHWFAGTRQEWLTWDGVTRMGPLEQDSLLEEPLLSHSCSRPERGNPPMTVWNMRPPVPLQCWNCSNLPRLGRVRVGRGVRSWPLAADVA